MDFSCRLRCFCALLYCPCPYLGLACGEVAHESQKVVALLNKRVKSCLLYSELAQKHLFFVCRKLCYLRFKLCADGKNLAALGFGDSLDLFVERVFFDIAREVVLAHVARIDDGLRRKQRDR